MAVIRGTRLPVTVVVGSLAGGMTFEEVQREYDLTADDIRAALLRVNQGEKSATIRVRNLLRWGASRA